MRIVVVLNAVVIVTATFCPGTAAPARDIFVNNVGGDDRSHGFEPEARAERAGPVRTLAKALRLADRGDRIVIANTGEPYRESLSLVGESHSGSLAFPFIIEGNGAVLDGSQPVPNDAWEHYSGDVFRFRPDRLAHQQLFVGGRPALRQPLVKDYTLPQLAAGQWCLSLGHIYYCVPTGQLPQTQQLAYASLQTGITLYQVRRVLITNLIVQGFQLDGINCFDSVFGAGLQGVTLRGNGRSGVSVGGASRVEIDQCLIGDNGAAQIRSEGLAKIRVTDCEVLANTAPAYVIQGGTITVDGHPPNEEKPESAPLEVIAPDTK